MMEFFVGNYIYEKNHPETQNYNFYVYQLRDLQATQFIISLLFIIFALYLAWKCNKKETCINRMLISFLAFTFSGFYLLYYFIYRIFMGKKC